ncbi:ATP-binding protein [uncultured Muribaculum sp.]|uniref:ATP-binding protein n=1 Tax=uncultured Muribaculum sp. TaxID=1918613 RepID=UPI0025EE018F|nr:ATP-binding protein [uncultured Muribaculum sp.]
MAHLSIRNIGPIKDIDIELNRVNIFLGPQSSGKSTIAKVLSFCQWLQKDVVIRQSIDHIDEAFVKKNLIDYHNISSYIDERFSEFHYKGRCIDIDYVKGRISVKLSGGYGEAAVSKNAYIPSERNIVGIPQSLSMELPANYLRSFLSDWINVRDKFRRSDSVKLMNLGVSYFYNESAGDDMIVMDADPDSPISLSHASSGLQSTTPLYVYIKYLTEWVYKHVEDRSPQRIRLIREGSARGAINAELPGVFSDPQMKPRAESLVVKFATIPSSEFMAGNEDSVFKKFREMEERLSRPSFSNIIIEEPEQNLFPQTQAMLVYDFFDMIDFERDNLTITTHSPFVIYAINNCMMAYKARMSSANIADRLSFKSSSWVDPEKVSVWELRDGYIKAPHKERNQTIQGEDGLIRDNYFDRVMNGMMADFKNLLAVSRI